MKKILCKISILLPLILFSKMLCNPSIALVIPQLHLYLTNYELLIWYTVICILWFAYSPFKTICKNNIYEVLYNIFPALIYLNFVFFQYNNILFFALILCAIVIVITLFIADYYKSKKEIMNNKDSHSKKRMRLYKSQIKKSILVIISVILMTPSLFALFKYNLNAPVLRHNKKTSLSLTDNKISVNSYEENMELFKVFSDNNWNKMSKEEKITALQTLADFECKNILKIPEVPINAVILEGEYALGQYINEEEEIEINIQYMLNNSSEACIETILHELHHAYVDYLVKNCENIEDNAISQTMYFDDLKAWKYNELHYVHAVEDFDTYENQAIEKDASEFAKKELLNIKKYIE